MWSYRIEYTDFFPVTFMENTVVVMWIVSLHRIRNDFHNMIWNVKDRENEQPPPRTNLAAFFVVQLSKDAAKFRVFPFLASWADSGANFFRGYQCQMLCQMLRCQTLLAPPMPQIKAATWDSLPRQARDFRCYINRVLW